VTPRVRDIRGDSATETTGGRRGDAGGVKSSSQFHTGIRARFLEMRAALAKWPRLRGPDVVPVPRLANASPRKVQTARSCAPPTTRKKPQKCNSGLCEKPHAAGTIQQGVSNVVRASMRREEVDVGINVPHIGRSA